MGCYKCFVWFIWKPWNVSRRYWSNIKWPGAKLQSLGQIGNIHIQAFNIASSASIDTNLRAASIPWCSSSSQPHHDHIQPLNGSTSFNPTVPQSTGWATFSLSIGQLSLKLLDPSIAWLIIQEAQSTQLRRRDGTQLRPGGSRTLRRCWGG